MYVCMVCVCVCIVCDCGMYVHMYVCMYICACVCTECDRRTVIRFSFLLPLSAPGRIEYETRCSSGSVRTYKTPVM